jgi:hypothetical protein
MTTKSSCQAISDLSTAGIYADLVFVDTDFIEIRFGPFGMLVVWGAYGRAYHSIILTSLEPE